MAIQTEKLIEQAQHEYTAGKFAEAERDLREITKNAIRRTSTLRYTSRKHSSDKRNMLRLWFRTKKLVR